MKEKYIQVIFGKKNKLFGFFELKLLNLEKSKSIRFDAVAAHQMSALKDVISQDGFYHKLTDPPIFPGMQTRFNVKRPFDCFKVCNMPAYIVIVVYVPRKRKTAYYVEPKKWVEAQKDLGKKSIRESELLTYASFLDNL